MSLHIVKSMDHRKKNIAELEQKKRESLRSLDLLLEDLGSRLLERAGEAGFPSTDVREYRRLWKEALDAQDRIKAIEEGYLHLQALDEEIEAKEVLQTARRGELSVLHRDLGKAVLDDPQNQEIPAFFRQRADLLSPQVDTLEARLADMETEETPNIFSWFGKKTRTLMTRSSLKKAKKKLHQLYETAGEQFSHSGGAESPAAKTGFLGKIQKLREQSRALAEDLAELRENRRKTAADTEIRGGPLKGIQELEKHIGRIKEELAALYRRFGEAAAAGAKKRFASLLHEDDQPSLGKIALIRKTVRDYDGEIERLQASLAVDEAKGEVRRLEKAVTEQRNRIAAAETVIAEYTQKIQETQARIEELAKLLE